MRNPHRSKTAETLKRAIKLLKTSEGVPYEEGAAVVKALELLRDRWSSAYSNSDGCCKRWLSYINQTQER